MLFCSQIYVDGNTKVIYRLDAIKTVSFHFDIQLGWIVQNNYGINMNVSSSINDLHSARNLKEMVLTPIAVND